MPYFAMPPLMMSTLQIHPARHLDGAAEGDLAVALGEVEVAHREPAALDVDREVDPRAARQILDVAVAAVLARRHGARALGGGLGLASPVEPAACARSRRRAGCASGGTRSGLVAMQRLLALVPGVEQLLDRAGSRSGPGGSGRRSSRRGCGASWCRCPGCPRSPSAPAGSGRSGSRRRSSCEKMPVKPHWLSGMAPTSSRSTTRMSPGSAPSTPIGPDRKCTMRQVDVAHVVGGVVVLDVAAGPVLGLDEEIVAGLDPGHDRNVRMPAVVDHVVLVGRLRQVDLDECLGHGGSSWLQVAVGLRRTDRRETVRHRRLVAAASSHDRAVLDDQHAVGDVEREAQHLLGDHDGRGRARRGSPSACAPDP